ncbi:MAG TPA: class I adenylate-forming enzyme family protein, partial [Burkholderiales bacterium]|nr:class I adenylate-forming enzyme family protein [Burkholderiales bacterium]
MRVEHFLRDSARRFPGKTAIVAGERRVSYATLAADAARVARALRAGGVGRGERVVVFQENSPETIAALFGALQAGAVFSVVNPGTKLDKLAYILNNCAARALVTEPKLAAVATEAAKMAPSLVTTITAPLPREDESENKIDIGEAGIDLD